MKMAAVTDYGTPEFVPLDVWSGKLIWQTLIASTVPGENLLVPADQISHQICRAHPGSLDMTC